MSSIFQRIKIKVSNIINSYSCTHQTILFIKEETKVDCSFLRGTTITQTKKTELHQCNNCEKHFHLNPRILSTEVRMWDKEKKTMVAFEMDKKGTTKRTVNL